MIAAASRSVRRRGPVGRHQDLLEQLAQIPVCGADHEQVARSPMRQAMNCVRWLGSAASNNYQAGVNLFSDRGDRVGVECDACSQVLGRHARLKNPLGDSLEDSDLVAGIGPRIENVERGGGSQSQR